MAEDELTQEDLDAVTDFDREMLEAAEGEALLDWCLTDGRLGYAGPDDEWEDA